MSHFNRLARAICNMFRSYILALVARQENYLLLKRVIQMPRKKTPKLSHCQAKHRQLIFSKWTLAFTSNHGRFLFYVHIASPQESMRVEMRN
jgi:hypothetical protein